jgi:hypothetical protein
MHIEERIRLLVCLVVVSLVSLAGCSSRSQTSGVQAGSVDVAAEGVAAASGTIPDGWQIIKETKGVCQFAVPAGWHIPDGQSVALEPGGQAMAILNVEDANGVGVAAWGDVKQRAREQYAKQGKLSVLEDGPARFWLQFSSQGTTSFWGIQQVGSHDCTVMVNVREKAAATYRPLARQMLASIGPAQ